MMIEPVVVAPHEVTAALRRRRFPVSTEAALQAEIERVLTEDQVPFEREARLGPGERVDFLVGESIALEAKTRCAKRIIYRQLERYAAHERVSALILITGTALGLPPTIAGKPLFYVSLGRSAL